MLLNILFYINNLIGNQPNELSGVVVSTNNQPIPFVHVMIEGTSIGNVTNSDGRFVLKLPKNLCKVQFLVSHINYETQKVKMSCATKTIAKIILNEHTLNLYEVVVSHLSAESIVRRAIENLKNNFELDSVEYTMFMRETEYKDAQPSMLKEFVFELYHDKKSKPDFHLLKSRAKAFDAFGKQNLKDERLISVHATESHMMLRYIDDFLKFPKMKHFNYNLKDEVIRNNESFYIIGVEPKTKSKGENLKYAELWVSHKDYGIGFLKEQSEDEYFNSGFNILERTFESFYTRNNKKWLFSHGHKSHIKQYKKKGIFVSYRRTVVATEISDSRSFAVNEEMGLMVQMLKEHLGEFDDTFWEDYNYIPLDSEFERWIETTKEP